MAEILRFPGWNPTPASQARRKRMVELLMRATSQADSDGVEIDKASAERFATRLLSHDFRALAEKSRAQRMAFLEYFQRDPAEIPESWGGFGRLVCNEANINLIGADFVSSAMTDARCMGRIRKFVESVAWRELEPERLTVEAESFAWEASHILNERR